jgi:glycosyltransferase involved in cell wall biosynthesis
MVVESDLDLSLVIPLYNEEESLTELSEWILRVVPALGLKFEILFVDDGSTDQSWEVIQKLSSKYPGIVKGISFKRNYGKSAALNTGFKTCKGRVVITMDADLQDSPDEIPELFRMIDSGEFELVSGWKKKRYDPISKTIPTKLFNAVTRYISELQLHDFNCGLKAYHVSVVKSIEIYGEMHRYIPVIAKWTGFRKIGEKVVEHRARKYGYTKFGLERFVYGFLDLLSITFVSKFRRRPMHFFGAMGIFSFLIGTIITLWVVAEKIYLVFSKEPVERQITDQPLFFLALVAVVVGVQLFMAGFIGEMLARSSHRNDYLIKATTSE